MSYQIDSKNLLVLPRSKGISNKTKNKLKKEKQNEC